MRMFTKIQNPARFHCNDNYQTLQNYMIKNIKKAIRKWLLIVTVFIIFPSWQDLPVEQLRLQQP